MFLLSRPLSFSGSLEEALAVDSIRCLVWTGVQTGVKTDAALNRDCLARGHVPAERSKDFTAGLWTLASQAVFS